MDMLFTCWLPMRGNWLKHTSVLEFENIWREKNLEYPDHPTKSKSEDFDYNWTPRYPRTPNSQIYQLS